MRGVYICDDDADCLCGIQAPEGRLDLYGVGVVNESKRYCFLRMSSTLAESAVHHAAYWGMLWSESCYLSFLVNTAALVEPRDSGRWTLFEIRAVMAAMVCIFLGIAASAAVITLSATRRALREPRRSVNCLLRWSAKVSSFASFAFAVFHLVCIAANACRSGCNGCVGVALFRWVLCCWGLVSSFLWLSADFEACDDKLSNEEQFVPGVTCEV